MNLAEIIMKFLSLFHPIIIISKIRRIRICLCTTRNKPDKYLEMPEILEDHRSDIGAEDSKVKFCG